ncbi:scopoletin glucosyltransferase-like [Actinidia eriantha]|uniref:scopoletin glucosyltransferase-like n=1 Tax=Actinidia eriantha TaxID=165200 RepID=UPI002590B03D|nr:scopoletin glucosyltransferase-like [Actinidia eriantha]XP_057493650.1 scopoletin glucosyltransferase-like [Actinidia eriantha]
MGSGQLHVFFFPMMAQGHMIPTLDMAKLFAAAGVKSTIITTPLNAHHFTKSLQRVTQLGLDMGILTVDFPAVAAGLPEGCENADQIPSDDMLPNFFRATNMLRDPLERLLDELRPNCLVADMFFPWATEAAAKFGIPRLVFHGMSLFALCAMENVRLHKPQRQVSSDDEPFLVPNLPHQIKLTKMQLSDSDRQDVETDFSKMKRRIGESELTSYGVIVNSFYELEPDYANHYRDVLGRRAWNVGPVSLCNRGIDDKAQRGKIASIDEHECLKWLDSKKPNSVIYVCFGSMADFAASQLFEIAMGLEASGQQFIWVVRRPKNEEEEERESWLPEGFEERMRERGLIIRGWAPQVLILGHEAIGGFVTHCGWNSTLEGVSSGVPMVTWPVFAEQFYNEKLVTEVLRVGVSVGARQWKRTGGGGVGREEVAAAVQRIVVGEEAEEMRRRARALKDKAKKAVEEGGSSYSDLNVLIQELSSYKA